MAEERAGGGGRPRIVEAERRQLRWQTVDLESLLPADHRARLVWATVESLDLGAFYDESAARGSQPGRPALDPKILLTLWLYATSEGIGSARHLARLCERDDAYRWICGGVTPSYHTLSDFRVAHGPKLDALLTQLLAALTRAGVLRLQRVAQDGVRVRAAAGAASFRRGDKLARHLVAAEAQVAALRAELEDDRGASTARERAARERAAREQAERVARALAELPKVQRVQERQAGRAARQRKGSGVRAPRVSTTDPEARVMKMGDGGYRPAVNMQYATDTVTRLVVGVDVTNVGTDAGQLTPMLTQVQARTQQTPAEYLVDGGYVNLEAIDAAAAQGITVYAPVPTPRTPGLDPHARKPRDTDHTAAWRARMATPAAQRIYAERAATAETLHADLRMWRGLRQLPVRGLPKALCIALWGALLHNILRADVLLRSVSG